MGFTKIDNLKVRHKKTLFIVQRTVFYAKIEC